MATGDDRPVIVDELEELLAALPDTVEALKERRKRLVDVLGSFIPAENPLAASIDECLKVLRSRSAELERAASGKSTDVLPQIEFHERETMAMEVPAAQVEPDRKDTRKEKGKEAADQAEHWDDAQRALYRDVLTLFDLGDQPGAMISLERLVMLAPDAQELQTFIEKNGKALEELYLEHFGSLERIPVPTSRGNPIKIPTDHTKVFMGVLRLADGHRTISELVKRSGLGQLPTLACIAHLARSGFLELA